MRSKAVKSHDVPRPQDTPEQCLQRIMQHGSNHAVCDLIEALERDKDPRGELLALLRERAMERIAACHDEERLATVTVTYWHWLSSWCVRVMKDDSIVKQYQFAKNDFHVDGLL